MSQPESARVGSQSHPSHAVRRYFIPMFEMPRFQVVTPDIASVCVDIPLGCRVVHQKLVLWSETKLRDSRIKIGQTNLERRSQVAETHRSVVSGGHHLGSIGGEDHAMNRSDLASPAGNAAVGLG